jgi:CheY-like chemotaxis protein
MIRMVVADMMRVLGHTIAAEAGIVDEALRLAQSTEFDLALLDINLRGEMITPVAEFIKASGCPIIFATAFGPDGLPEEYRDHPFVQKPFEVDPLAIAIDKVF